MCFRAGERSKLTFLAHTTGANVDLLHTRIHPEIIPPRKGSQGLSCKPDLPSIFPRLGESFVLGQLHNLCADMVKHAIWLA
jgi:hypothetical protein